MRLKTLTLRAFKGVRDFTLDANGQDATVFGANGVGKTSLDDAFNWLLFGRDSLGRADFGIIPVAPDELLIPSLTDPLGGGDAHRVIVERLEALLGRTPPPGDDALQERKHLAAGIDQLLDDAAPTVTAELILPDGDSITLMRRLLQKKQSIRGAEPTAAGTTTEFMTDGVPVKKSDYTKRVAEIADETLFPLLTDPRAFCGSLHWQKRREQLMRLFGGASDADIIAGEPELAALPALLGKRSADDHKRMLAPRIADLKKQLAAIPPRIDEVRRGIPPSPDGDPADELLAALREDRKRASATLERIASGGEAAELRRQLAEINARILDAETAAKRAHAERLAELVAVKSAAGERLRERQHLLDDIDHEIESIRNKSIAVRAKAIANDKARDEVSRRQPPDAGFDDTCPACGQDIPAEQVRAAAEAALAEFNLRRSRDLESIDAAAKSLAAEIARYDAALAKLYAEAEAALSASDEAVAAFNAARAAVEDLPPADTRHPELQAEADAIIDRIAALDDGNAAALADARATLDDIDALIIHAECAAADMRSHEQAADRIAALNDERRTVAADLDTAESELALCALFTRRKMEQISHSINSRFGGLTWKLFDQQVNGEIADCCEATVNGVAWRDLSNSQQINAGLAVIDVIGQQYGVTPPIFIDNAESVSEIRPTKAQQIRLIVSPAHKQLTVETIKS